MAMEVCRPRAPKTEHVACRAMRCRQRRTNDADGISWPSSIGFLRKAVSKDTFVRRTPTCLNPLSERTEQEPRNARGRKRASHPPSRVGLQRSCRRGTREEEGPALGWRAHNAIVSANKTHPHASTQAGHTISRAREGEEATLSTRLGDGDSTQSQKKKQASAVFWRRLDSWTTNGIELESSTDMRIPQKNHAG